MKEKTILVLTSTFPRWKSDAEPRFVYDLCIRLQCHFNVIVLAPHTSGAAREEVVEGLRVHRFRYAPTKLENIAYNGGITSNLKKSKINWLILPFFLISECFSIWKLLGRYPVDVIHAHWLVPHGALALLSRVFRRKKPAILCTSHGGDLYGLQDRLSTMMKRVVINRTDALTVVSTAMKEKVIELSGAETNNVQVISMGSDLRSQFVTDSTKKRKENRLLFVGRLVPKKGLTYLIDILPELIVKFPDIRLYIAGTGPEKSAIEGRISSLSLERNVVFLGIQSHTELIKLYQESSLSVFPFIRAHDGDMEGLGLVMVEALGCGCPVVAGDVPAVKDVLEHEKTGLIVDVVGHDSLKCAIDRMLLDPKWAQESGRRGNEYVLQYFDWDIVTSKYKELIDSLAYQND